MSSTSSNTNSKMNSLILELERIGAVKFGEFTLKSGLTSPVYFDLRILVSFPKLLEEVAALLLEKVTRRDCVLCGVPYTALPIATLMSVKADLGMVVRRKEAKSYGTKKMVEGVWTEGQNCVIVEDVVTTGGSVIETANLLRKLGMTVTECIVLLDREQGAVDNLTKAGISVITLISVSKVLEVLLGAGRISSSTVEAVNSFVLNNQTQGLGADTNSVLKTRFETRLDTLKNVEKKQESTQSELNLISTRLMEIMLRKRTNLCVAVDLTSAQDILELVEKIGSSVAVVKLHADIVNGWTEQTEAELKKLADKFGFLLFEDRKLADIGNTVRLQALKFSSWAQLVTVHALPGPGVLQAVRDLQKSSPAGLGVLLVAEMSSAGNLISRSYTQETVNLGEKNKNVVVGFIAQSRVSQDNDLIQLTPGVHLSQDGDKTDQRYVSPADAVLKRGADLIIVGRGITGAEDPAGEAERYKNAGWNAYLERTGQV